MLTPLVAQEIARETSTAIGFNVLITDQDGIVIGSGDASRVGSYHEASIEVMRTLRPASHGADAASRLVGVQPGITLPVTLRGEAVGTVGITGDPAQVERFGLVVRSQTEILLRESLLLRSRLVRESAIEDLLRDIAHYDPKVTEPDFIAFKAAELGYELRLPRSVVVIDVDAPAAARAAARAAVRAGARSGGGGLGDAVEGQGHAGPGDRSGGQAGDEIGRDEIGGDEIGGDADGLARTESSLRSAVLRAIRRAFPGSQDVVGATASGRFVVLHRSVGGSGRVGGAGRRLTVGAATGRGTTAEGGMADVTVADGATPEVVARCYALADDLARSRGVACRIGVGGAATDVLRLRDSYRDASTALHLSARLCRRGPVTSIDEVRVHDLLATVAPEARARFAAAVAGALRDDPDWPTIRSTVMAWCESGFNLVRASAALHVHRNTLVYRLDKIEKLAGVSVRDPRAGIPVYLACLVDELDDDLDAEPEC